jgi:glycosyltransferase involved in cell wall biosynthesis
VRVLVVSSYPPRHCGIGAYAHAQVTKLRAAGDEVVVLSPPDGDGDERVDFLDGRPFRRAAALAHSFDRVVVHFEPGIYFRRRAPVSKVRTAWGLARLVTRAPQVEIVLHEVFPRPIAWRPDHRLVRRALRRATLVVHTEAERDALAAAYGVGERVRVVPHTDGVLVREAPSREDARRRLGVAPEERLYVCAGFLHPAKGYERAIEAFEAAGSPGRLVVLASVRMETEENVAYGRWVASLADRVPGVDLVERYVPDDEFDAWLVAADAVVLPYRQAWSSGVLARARVLGTPAIVSAVGGLADQAGPDDVVFTTDDELRTLFERGAPVRAPA